MEFYNLTIEGISPTVGHQLIVFGDLKENLFAATKVIVDEELKALHDIGTTYYETNVLEKSIEFQNSILPIVEQLYADGFFNEVLDPNVDTDTIYEYTYLTYQDRNYTILLENTNTTVRGKYTVARLYEERIDAIVNKIAQAHKKVGQLPCPSLTLRGHGLLYSKPSTNVFQLLDSKLYKVCTNQLSKQ